MKLALCPLSRNVVRANAASPSGAGSAAGTPSTSVTGRSTARTAMQPPRVDCAECSRTDGPFVNRSAMRLRREVVRVPRDELGPVVGDDEDVLETDAAEAGAIEARLERDHVAGDEVVAGAREIRLLVHLEA